MQALNYCLINVFIAIAFHIRIILIRQNVRTNPAYPIEGTCVTCHIFAYDK